MERVSKYRVDDDWIDCEIAYLKKRMKFDDSDAVLTTETSVPILFALLEEIKERRESDTSGGVTMERVTDERIADILDGLLYNKHSVIAALRELQARRKAEKEHVHTDNSASEKDGAVATQEKPVLPIPCTKGYEEWTVKDGFQKVNEELDELKETVLTRISGMNMNMCDTMDEMYEAGAEIIADEAADTITAITSMLEAMGINEKARQAAQERVNERNKERDRL